MCFNWFLDFWNFFHYILDFGQFWHRSIQTCVTPAMGGWRTWGRMNKAKEKSTGAPLESVAKRLKGKQGNGDQGIPEIRGYIKIWWHIACYNMLYYGWNKHIVQFHTCLLIIDDRPQRDPSIVTLYLHSDWGFTCLTTNLDVSKFGTPQSHESMANFCWFSRAFFHSQTMGFSLIWGAFNSRHTLMI